MLLRALETQYKNLNGSVDRVTNSITHNIFKMKIKFQVVHGQMLQWRLLTNGKTDTIVEEVQTTKQTL